MLMSLPPQKKNWSAPPINNDTGRTYRRHVTATGEEGQSNSLNNGTDGDVAATTEVEPELPSDEQ